MRVDFFYQEVGEKDQAIFFFFFGGGGDGEGGT